MTPPPNPIIIVIEGLRTAKSIADAVRSYNDRKAAEARRKRWWRWWRWFKK